MCTSQEVYRVSNVLRCRGRNSIRILLIDRDKHGVKGVKVGHARRRSTVQPQHEEAEENKKK